MKNLIKVAVSFSGFLFIGLVLANILMAQSAGTIAGVAGAIPENVMKIAERSCVSCHSEPGNADALARLNLTNWDKYSPDKQASKAQSICIMISKDKMPPATYRGTHPESVLTTDEIKTIYAWAQSLQNAKK
jgi:hypothetical protein